MSLPRVPLNPDAHLKTRDEIASSKVTLPETKDQQRHGCVGQPASSPTPGVCSRRGEVRGSMARRSSLAAALVLAVVVLLAPAEAKGSKGVRRNSALHGKPRKKGRRPPPRKKKRREYDYDDDDDDDDDFGGGSRQMTYYKPRRKPTGPSVLQRAQAMAKEASARGLEMSKVAASRAKDLP